MGRTWGDGGPPEEAYSRVTRDLAEVTAGFTAFLDELPARLVGDYDAQVRTLTGEEMERLNGSSPKQLDEAYAIEPADTDSATLLLGRGSYEGGTTVILSLGVAIDVKIPDCFCDACDEDSESLIEQANQYIHAAVTGCREFRRPDKSRRRRPFEGARMEHGVEWRGGASAWGGKDIRGEPFSRRWRPWPRRQPSEGDGAVAGPSDR